MIINPMNNIFDINQVDMSYFNRVLMLQGGKALKTDKPKISMREFIFKLIKTFRKDFNKKKKGGIADLHNETNISYSTRYGDLTFAPYTFEPILQLERDIL